MPHQPIKVLESLTPHPDLCSADSSKNLCEILVTSPVVFWLVPVNLTLHLNCSCHKIFLHIATIYAHQLYNRCCLNIPNENYPKPWIIYALQCFSSWIVNQPNILLSANLPIPITHKILLKHTEFSHYISSRTHFHTTVLHKNKQENQKVLLPCLAQ